MDEDEEFDPTILLFDDDDPPAFAADRSPLPPSSNQWLDPTAPPDVLAPFPPLQDVDDYMSRLLELLEEDSCDLDLDLLQCIHGNQAAGMEESLGQLLVDGGSSGENMQMQQPPPVGVDSILPAAGTNQVADDALLFEQQMQIQVGPEPDPTPTAPAAGVEHLSAAAAASDDEMSVDEMVRMAAECGEDEDARTVWSQEEHTLLLQRLHLYANDDSVVRCLKIARHLPKKTALDVALRCCWLQDKEKTAKEADLVKKDVVEGKVKKDKKKTVKEVDFVKKDVVGGKVKKDKEKTVKEAELVKKDLAEGMVKKDKKKTVKESEPVKEDLAGAKVEKVKRTNGTKNNKKVNTVSKEALDFKITKELILDNYRFLNRIEENLKTGQLGNTADYFYNVKTNMDAIEKRLSGHGVDVTMPPIDEEGLEEILRSRLSSLV